MGRLSRHAAYHGLLKKGPWTTGSAHGYHPKGTQDCSKHENEDWRHVDNGKYGQGYKHCIFCSEDFPFHKEYCPWQDFFFSWTDPNPMPVEYQHNKAYIPVNCKIGDHEIDEA